MEETRVGATIIGTDSMHSLHIGAPADVPCGAGSNDVRIEIRVVLQETRLGLVGRPNWGGGGDSQCWPATTSITHLGHTSCHCELNRGLSCSRRQDLGWRPSGGATHSGGRLHELG